MPPGRVVVLNGTSSSGKTTLAAALQADRVRAGECWIVIGLDDFLAKLPAEWVLIGDHAGAFAEDGIVFETIDGRVERRIGPVGEQLLMAYRRAVGSAARAGLNVIVDEVLLSEADWRGWQEELRGLEPVWVRVQADPEIVDAREHARGDRVVGMARAQHAVVHAHATYDVEVDTGTLDPAAATATVVAALSH